MGSIFEQFVMYTAILDIYFRFITWFVFFNIFFIFSFFYCYYFTCFKTVIFSCGLPINGFWLSGVSREIKNDLILLLNRTKK